MVSKFSKYLLWGTNLSSMLNNLVNREMIYPLFTSYFFKLIKLLVILQIFQKYPICIWICIMKYNVYCKTFTFLIPHLLYILRNLIIRSLKNSSTTNSSLQVQSALRQDLCQNHFLGLEDVSG